MTIQISNEDLAKGLKELADKEGVEVDQLVNDLLAFSLDNAIATLAMRRIEFQLNDLYRVIKDIEINSYAVRHQVLNMHADILENPDRAIAINEEAGKIGHQMAFEEEENEDDDE